MEASVIVFLDIMEHWGRRHPNDILAGRIGCGESLVAHGAKVCLGDARFGPRQGGYGFGDGGQFGGSNALRLVEIENIGPSDKGNMGRLTFSDKNEFSCGVALWERLIINDWRRSLACLLSLARLMGSTSCFLRIRFNRQD